MRRAAVVASLLAAPSCDRTLDDQGLPLAEAPSVFFTEFCARQTECCSAFDIPSMAQCEANITTQIELMKEVAQDEELTYDSTCWLAEVEHLRARDCEGEAIADDECTPACRPFHGGQQLDEYCSNYDFALTNCVQGLVCAPAFCPATDCPDTCQDPCARSELGEPCLGVPCDDGLVCDVVLDECARAPSLGEPCVWGSCGEGAMCDENTDACVPAVADSPDDPAGAPGTPCNAYWQCESGSCPAGYCAELPGEGEDCTARCRDGLECDPMTQRCGEPGPAICADDPL